MTEDEAKAMWCPFSRVIEQGSAAGAHNRCQEKSGTAVKIPMASRCIASACMAWRWNEPWTSQTEEGHGGDLVIRLKRKPGEPRLGYCGLAGSVQ